MSKVSISTTIAKLTPSERRLALAVLVLLVGAILFFVVMRCLDILEALDATIESQERLLLQYTQQAALAEPVERAFQSMASQHSSKWSQQEIHDRLRFEITRLSLRQVPEEGAPLPTNTKAGDNLVEIRAMPAGALDDSGVGYRTYRINFRTEPTSIQNIATFLQRLQQSPQALRVDFLELTRAPLSDQVAAEIHVTRTVIGDATDAVDTDETETATDTDAAASSAGNLARNGSFEQFDAASGQAPEWTATGAALKVIPEATHGAAALAVDATAPNATFAQHHQLRAGVTYELAFDAQAMGGAKVNVVNDVDGTSLGEATPIPTASPRSRYRFLFTAPGEGAGSVAMRVPVLTLDQIGTAITIDNVVLREYVLP
ncbi:MAG TPA: hypothetical protein PLJ47_05485 [Candidatus Hydrogenedentes bacterium]|nr:hypothetical protein [Candidatus Hydrogenedentota bacterium]